MAEKPILFSGPMVRALLDGRKTQTRRVVKLPHNDPLGEWEPIAIGGPDGGRTAAGETIPLQGGIWHTRTGDGMMSPYGQPGDRLWVRETHAIVPRTAYARSDGVNQVLRPEDDHDAAIFREGWERSKPGHWLPSIHMPRWASRILLEVTSVRVERLQEISEADAIAEGVDGAACAAAVERAPSRDTLLPVAVHGYANLWESLNAARGYGWSINCWVWVIEFRRIL